MRQLVFKLFLSLFVLAVLQSASYTAKGDTITFDSPGSTGAVQLSSTTFQGFTFSSVANFNHVLSGHFSNAVSHNGTSFLVVSPGVDGALVMTNGGSPFSITSFDADTFTHILGVTTITVTGTFVGGGTITQVFATDAIGDGPGGAADFQTFTLVGFSNLNAIQFSSVTPRAFAVDNFCVTSSAAPVPEPATMILLGSGLTGLGALVRRRRSRS
jgi:hypothetical protein